VCEQLAQVCYLAVEQPGVKHVTSQYASLCFNHYIMRPQSMGQPANIHLMATETEVAVVVTLLALSYCCSYIILIYKVTILRLSGLYPGQPGEPVPEGTFCHLLDFLEQNENNTRRHTNNLDGLPLHQD